MIKVYYYIYDTYDNDCCVCYGSLREVCKYLNAKETTIQNYNYTNCLYSKRYRIDRMRIDTNDKKQNI